MCQYRFINCNKCFTLVGMVIVGEVVHVWEQWLYRNSLHFLLNIAKNLKLL